MDRHEFVRIAGAIVAARGEPHHGGRKYEDDRVVIRTHYNGLDLEVTRKAMDDPDLSGTNPVTMVSAGEVIRHHGEHRYLTDHLLALEAAI